MAGDKPTGSGKETSGETIDVNSPYYIHPSDYPKQMQVNDVLNDHNYNEWKQEMTNFLLAKNKMGLIDGTIEKPGAESPMSLAWVRADAMIKGWLTTAMEREIRTSVRYAKTSSEIWRDLEERFEKEGAPRAYELKQTFNAIRQGGTTVSNYYTKLRSIWDELQLVLPTPRCACEGCKCNIGKMLNDLKEKERTYDFLMGLDDDFSVIRTQILAMKPTPPLSIVYHLLAEDEQQRAITTGSKRPNAEATAFQVNHSNRKVAQQNQGRQQYQSSQSSQQPSDKGTSKYQKSENDKKQYCTFCSKEGHNRDGCFKIIGYPDWWPGKKDKPRTKATCVELGPSPIAGLTDEQYHLFVNHFKEENVVDSKNTQPMAHMAGKIDSNYEWVVDSGATEHITHRIDFLENVTKNPKETPVVIPNGEKVSVEGEGIHFLPGGIKINRVHTFQISIITFCRLGDLQIASIVPLPFFHDFL